MFKDFSKPLLLMMLLLISSISYAEPIPVSRVSTDAIGQYAEVFFEPGEHLAIDEARSLFDENGGVRLGENVLSFGMISSPLWLKFSIDNPTEKSVEKIFSIETSWLNALSIYIYQDDNQLAKYAMGDELVQTDRPVDSRFYVVDYDFEPGLTEIYVRVAGTDPMLLPIFLNDRKTFAKRFEIEDYSYGILYGVLGALAFYNLMLFVSLRSVPHLAYTIYLLTYIALNLSYTGHGFRWFWPDNTYWQQWSNPVLMIAGGVAMMLFACCFLKIRKTLPKLFWIVVGITIAILIAFGAAYYLQQIQTALVLGFVYTFIYSVLMIVIGVLAFKAGNPSAKYFLPATTIVAICAAVTVMTIWNVLPYSVWAYRSAEVGMVIEALLLALALADQFRRGEIKRVFAEEQARKDPLTGLNNRRAFQEQVKTLWQHCRHEKLPAAIIMIDLDFFKKINDQHGHLFGDRVLQATAQQLQVSLRDGDVLARWGGEEFILFMPDTTTDTAEVVAERIRERIFGLAECFPEIASLTLSASLGVADSRGGAESLDALINQADDCLYRAKKSGRNQVDVMLYSVA